MCGVSHFTMMLRVRVVFMRGAEHIDTDLEESVSACFKLCCYQATLPQNDSDF